MRIHTVDIVAALRDALYRWLERVIPEPMELDSLPDEFHDEGCNRKNCFCDSRYI